MVLAIKENVSAKKFFPKSRHIINYAFSLGNKHYFRFNDHLNVPYERALSCLVYYREIEMNCDHSFLEKHVEAVNKILLSNPIDIFKIKEINDQLQQRLKMPKDPELMYKLASVVFFDQDENPEVYEWTYCKKKIEYWKKNTDLAAFFLQRPLQELIPYLQYAGENLETFSQLVEDANNRHSDTLHGILSGEPRMTSSVKKDSSQAVTPQS